MQITQSLIAKPVFGGVSLNSTTATSNAVEIDNCAEILVVVQFGVVGATMSALAVQECDTSGGSYTTIPGCDASVSPGVLPTTAYAGKCLAFYIPNNGGRKKFISVLATAGASATIVSAMAYLGTNTTQPWDAASAGYAEVFTATT